MKITNWFILFNAIIVFIYLTIVIFTNEWPSPRNFAVITLNGVSLFLNILNEVKK